MQPATSTALPSIPLKKQNPALSSFTPLEYGGETVGWFGLSYLKKQLGMSVRVVVGGECFVLTPSQGLYAGPGRAGYPEECGEPLQSLFHAGFPVILNCPKDSVELSPSKNEIVFSELTQTTIEALTDDFIRTFQQYVQKVINAQESRFDALSIALHFWQSPLLHSHQFTWRGETFPLLEGKSNNQHIGHRFKHEGRMWNYSIKSYGTEIHDESNFYLMVPRFFCENLYSQEAPMLIVTAKDEMEYAEAMRIIREHAISYKAANVGVKKSLDIVLAFSGEPLLKWFNGSQKTIQQFEADSRSWIRNPCS